MATGQIEDQADTGYIDLAIKANAGLTKKLANLLHVNLDEESLGATNADLAVLVEGPYGSLHEEVRTHFDTLQQVSYQI